jgi:hypothetical protein
MNENNSAFDLKISNIHRKSWRVTMPQINTT